MRSNEQLVQETLLAQLSEYQHQQQQLREFDIVDKIGKGVGRVAGAAAKGVGAVAGGVAGLGQAVKKGYQAGKATTGAGGADPAASGTAKPAAKPAASGTAKPAASGTAQPAASGTAQPAAKSGGSKIMKGLQAVGRGIGAVGDLKSKVQGYDVAKGTELQQRALANNLSVAQQKQKEKDEKDAEAKAATPQAQAELKRKKDLEAQLGTTGAAAAAANAAANAARTTAQADNKAINKSIARNRAKGGAAPTATTVPGQKPAATGTATSTATQVPGQKPAPAATATDTPAKTAQDIAAKTGADAPTKKPDLKIAGQKVKPTDPLYDKLVAMIPAETRSSIDGLSDYDKGRLKKELSA